jgi:hypothetical protein
VPKGIKSEDGGQITEDLQFEFSTPRPRVEKTIPKQSDKFIDPTASVAAKINLPISQKSAEEHFHLYSISNNKEKEIPVNIILNKNLVGMHPIKPLKRDQKFKAVIEAGLKSNLGPNPTTQKYSWNFKTIPLPGITGTKPEKKEKDVDEEHQVVVNFLSPMDEDSFENNVLITPQPDKPPHLYFSSYKNQLRISSFFKRNTQYRITVKTGVRDKYGMPLSSPYTFSFTTGDYKPSISIHPSNTYFASFNQEYIPRIVSKVVNTSKIT